MILDTNALSAAAEKDPGVISILEGAAQLALPVIVIGEYRYGIARSRHMTKYQLWLEGLIADCTVLDISEQTTRHYADVAIELTQSGKPIPTNDIWIAALCRQHGLPLLSRDQHFDVVPGLQRIVW